MEKKLLEDPFIVIGFLKKNVSYKNTLLYIIVIVKTRKKHLKKIQLHFILIQSLFRYL